MSARKSHPFQFALPNWSPGRSGFQTLSAVSRLPSCKSLLSLSELTVGHFGYLAMLLFTVVGSFWLEIVYKVQVLRRARRVLYTVSPVALLFLLWDVYAIHQGHWHFDAKQIIGVYLPGRLPLEEFLFCVIIPLAAIMTIEAVRSVKKDWPVE